MQGLHSSNLDSGGLSDEHLWFLRSSSNDFLSRMKNVHQVLNICRRSQRYCYMYPLKPNQDLASRLHCFFLTAPPWSLYPLPSLISNSLNLSWASLVAQTVMRLPTMWEARVRFLGREDPLEKKEMAIHSSTLAWKIPWTEEPERTQPKGSQRVGHD